MNTNELIYRDQASKPKASKHIKKRVRQRGLCEKDFDVISQAGEEFQDGYLMSTRAVSERIGRLKAEIQRLERLRGIVLIEQEDTFVTVYRADRKRCKRILGYGQSQIAVKQGGQQ